MFWNLNKGFAHLKISVLIPLVWNESYFIETGIIKALGTYSWNLSIVCAQQNVYHF